MDAPWPQWLINSFAIANQTEFAADESAYYGPYNRLLFYLFGIEGPFDINFDLPKNSYDSGAVDTIALFTVELNNHPVLFIEIKAPASFVLDSRRRQADNQMRDHFLDLRHNLVTPRLPGISVFGTRLAFYEYVAATNKLTPCAILPDPESINDLAPAERWSYDLLEANGTAQVRQVVEDVKAMCQAAQAMNA